MVFMGSDAFSVPSLERCLAHAEVAGVFTQPDRRGGRGRKPLAPSPVKKRALDAGLPVEQPEKFDKRCLDRLRAFGPDLTVVAAYGQILPRAALEAARLDSINVHASLLPRHRGASPIAAAVLAGDREAGVTIMKLRPKLDAGEILCCGEERRRAQRATPIGEHETTGELAERLAKVGGELLAEVLAAFADGSVTYELQDASAATYAPMLRKSDGVIDWSRSPEQVIRHVRAMTPWPGSYSALHLPDRPPLRVMVLDARPGGTEAGPRPGSVRTEGGRLLVSAGGGAVEIRRAKPAGRNAMGAVEFVRGCPALTTGQGWSGDCWFGNT